MYLHHRPSMGALNITSRSPSQTFAFERKSRDQPGNRILLLEACQNMHPSLALLAFILPLAAPSKLHSPHHIFQNPSDVSALRIPTIRESAVLARRILSLETIGTLSTVFPSSSHHVEENRPSNLGGIPIGLMDYFGDCEPETGNPTILAIDIATSFQNVAAGSNITLSMRYHPSDYNPRKHSAANLPRFSLVGYLEKISKPEVEKQRIPACFAKKHPDSRLWMPGNPIHESEWVRLVVQDVYWIGGFGDRNYIGWIPVEEWRSVTKQEIHRVRLPGENRLAEGFRTLIGKSGL